MFAAAGLVAVAALAALVALVFAPVVASLVWLVRRVGDSYDNALAETVIGLYKTELIRQCGPWRGLEHVEFATLEWVDWFNNRRLLGPIGDQPPVEYEQAYYQQHAPAMEAGLN